MRLQLKIILLICASVLGVSFLSLAVVDNIMRKTLEAEFTSKGMILAGAIAETVGKQVINNQLLGATDTIKAVLSRTPHAEYAYIKGFDGQLFAHTFPEGFPKALLPALHSPPQASGSHVGKYLLQGKPISEVTSHLVEGMKAELHIGFNEEYHNQRYQALRRQIMIIALSIILAGVIVSYLVSRQVIRSVRDISILIEKFGRGELQESVELKDTTPEMASLVNSFNEMIINLHKSEEENRWLITAIEQAAESIIITDREGVIQYVNPCFVQSTGYSAAEAIGQTPRILKSDCHDSSFYQQLWQTLTSGEAWRGKLINRKKDGSLFEEESSITPVFNEDHEIVSFVAVKRDISEAMKLEHQLRQAQKMEAIGTLAGGIAHDFNNILSVIFGYAEMIKHNDDDPRRRSQDLEELLLGARRAKELVRQILAFSRKTEQQKQPLRISLLIKEALKLLRASIPATIEIKQNIATDSTILADPTQMHQVIMNLCTNAYHAMRASGGILAVSASEVEIGPEDEGYGALAPGSYLKVEVTDSGCGIAPEFLEKIFDPYFTTKGTGEGTGLGLAVVHGIIKSHHGHITVYSEPDKGSSFYIYLPLIQRQGSAPPPTERVEEIRGRGEQILFIDDEEQIRQVAQRVLSEQGYKPSLFSDGLQALNALREEPDRFDLVVTDMTMPHMTGAELAREIIAIRPGVPIILCSGQSEIINREKILAMGFCDYLTKPIPRRDFLAAVSKALGRKEITVHQGRQPLG